MDRRIGRLAADISKRGGTTTDAAAAAAVAVAVAAVAAAAAAAAAAAVPRTLESYAERAF